MPVFCVIRDTTASDFSSIRCGPDTDKFIVFSATTLAKEIQSFYRTINFSNVCYVHADLHKGNFLIDSNGKFVIIDFGDAKIAPKFCELPPIICNTYNFNIDLIKNTFGDNLNKIKEDLLKGFIVNDFATDYIQDLCNYLNFGNIKKIKIIKHLKTLIDQAFDKANKK